MIEALGLILTFVTAFGSATPRAAPQAGPAGPVARITATTSNLKAGPDSVRIDVLAWSNDAARRQLLDAWIMIAPVTAPRGAGAAGRGAPAARGARGTGGPAAAGARRG